MRFWPVVSLQKATPTHSITVFRAALLHCMLLCLIEIATLAQYRYDHWTAESGLPQNMIAGLHQTPDGYLWIATLDGLARFDGVRFTTFDKRNSPGIRNNRFTTLYEDRQGDLWLVTESNGVTRFSRGRFATYGAENELPSGMIRGFTQAEQVLVRAIDLVF